MNQIKLFTIRLLQNFKIKASNTDITESNRLPLNTIETKELLFNTPKDGVLLDLIPR